MQTEREMAEEMGFSQPSGDDLLRNGDNAITLNAQKAALSAFRRRALIPGEDMNDLTLPGLYWSNNYATANSLLNGPRTIEAVDRAVVLVSATAGGEALQQWSALGTVDAAQRNMIARRRDSSGAWSPWMSEHWTQRSLVKGENMNDLITPGMYWIPTYSVANSLVNGSKVRDTVNRAVVEVGADRSGYYYQKWTTLNPASKSDSPIVQRRADNTGAWTDWRRIDAIDTLPLAGMAATSTQQSQEGILRIVAGLVADSGQPWRWTAPAGTQLVVPTHEGSGQSCHPAVLYFPDKWNGWEYWMVHTPYPWADEAHEDPNIVVSHNGTDWEVPAGLTNPLDDQAGSPDPYNSDGHIVMLDDGRMMVSWRTVDRPNQNTNIFYQRISSDGINWTPRTELFRAAPSNGFVSQALAKAGDTWRLYGISGSELIYYESPAEIPGVDDWGTRKTCSLTELPTGRGWWHVDVQNVNGNWWLIVSDAVSGSTTDGNIYIGKSTDGVTWDISPTPLVPKIGANHDTMYKTGFIVKDADNSIDVFYSAFRRDTNEWHIYRTEASKITAV